MMLNTIELDDFHPLPHRYTISFILSLCIRGLNANDSSYDIAYYLVNYKPPSVTEAWQKCDKSRKSESFGNIFHLNIRAVSNSSSITFSFHARLGTNRSKRSETFPLTSSSYQTKRATLSTRAGFQFCMEGGNALRGESLVGCPSWSTIVPFTACVDAALIL